MAATVRPGGWFVLDFLNALTVRDSLADCTQSGGPEGTRAGAVRYLSDDGRFVVKMIAIPDGRRFLERVRLFNPDELEGMLIDAGLRVRERFGDYEGGALAVGAPRTILMGQPT
jgi:hypothetical protein